MIDGTVSRLYCKLNMRVTVLLLTALFLIHPDFAFAQKVDFGNYTSQYIVHKAWEALAAKDYSAAKVYADKTISLYSAQAKKMQASLSSYPSGSNEEIFKYWALNDVGTAMVVLGDVYKYTGKKEESLKVFQQIIEQYSYAQCWDTHGWFWRPASVAKDQLGIAAQGVDVDFGDYTSSYLVQKAWVALARKDLKSVILYARKTEELYGDKARAMQHSLKQEIDSPLAFKQNTFNYWALNDVGTALFILGEAYRKTGHWQEADDVYWKIIKEYNYAQCWKRLGGFWKPADVAQKRLGESRSRQSLFGF